jgi:hypothetical protein
MVIKKRRNVDLLQCEKVSNASGKTVYARTSALTTSHNNLSMTQRNRTSVIKLKAATQSLLGSDAIASLTMASRP